MAKTKEEVKEFILKQNWCNAWIANLALHSYSFPKTLDESLEYMYKKHSRIMPSYITCNYVAIHATPQRSEYWEKIGEEFKEWYNS